MTLKYKFFLSYSSGSQKSKMYFTRLKSRCQQVCIRSGDSGSKSVSLPFLLIASRSSLCSFAYSPSCILKASNIGLSLSHAAISVSDYSQESPLLLRIYMIRLEKQVKKLPANAGGIRDADLIPGLERSPGREHGNPLQYSCLENPMDRGAWLRSIGSQRVGHD